jgi:hypothetical protein
MMQPAKQLLCLALVMLSSAQAADVVILPAARRDDVLAKSTALAAYDEVKSEAATKNPYVLRQESAPAETQVAAPVVSFGINDAQLVQQLIAQMDVRGVMMVRDIPRLKVGQKIVKAGDSLMLSHEGAVYDVQITALDASRFTIRYKNEEASRPTSPKNVK